MCHMVSEVLLRASNVAASCATRAFNDCFKAPELSYSSFFSRSSTAGLIRHQSLGVRQVTSMKAVCCQDITPFSKEEDRVSVSNCNIEHQYSSFDHWIEDCVCDIVRNINDAPFLHMLFDSQDSRRTAPSQWLRVEEGGDFRTDDRWKEVKEYVSKASPDGVVLVNQLKEPPMEWCCVRDACFTGIEKQRDCEELPSTTKLWGVLLLGKRISRNACYILKTTSVHSSFGSCTQFCLTKAKCFGPSWHEQMQNSWLLHTENTDHSNEEGS